MKIAWFSPFCKQSAIGKVSQSVLNYLRLEHQVDLWLSQQEDLLTTSVNTIFYSQHHHIDFSLCQKLLEYDAIFYNFGNYRLYHQDIYLVSQRFPGIVILHDYINHHFFLDYSSFKQDPNYYINLMQITYPGTGQQIAQESISGKTTPIWDQPNELFAFPLFEPLIEGAKGVVTHSDWCCMKIKSQANVPVKYLPLPCATITNEQLSKTILSEDNKPRLNPKLKLLTIGDLNRNKCINEIIRLLGTDSEMAKRVEYHLIGNIQASPTYFNELSHLVEQYGLQKTVFFHGYLSDEMMHEHLLNTDICVTLRFPASESGSASVLEQMAFKKAIIVSDTGCYAELPDETVLKAKPNDHNSLRKMLTLVIQDESLRIQIGETARQFVLKHHTAEHYAKGIVQFALSITNIDPALKFIDKVGRELDRMNVQPFMPSITRIAAEVNYMVNKTNQNEGN